MATQTKLQKARAQLHFATVELERLQVKIPELVLQKVEHLEDKVFGIIVERWLARGNPKLPRVVLFATPYGWDAYVSACDSAMALPTVQAMLDYLKTGYRSKP